VLQSDGTTMGSITLPESLRAKILRHWSIHVRLQHEMSATEIVLWLMSNRHVPCPGRAGKVTAPFCPGEPSVTATRFGRRPVVEPMTSSAPTRA